jgi:excinuclease UvrABC helicase subunit UvrB
MPEPDLEAQLDELERHLETVVAHLEAEEFEEARKHTLDISTLLNCGMCKGIENGVLGGVMFAAGMTPATSQRRVEMVTDEIESFIDTELVAARQLARNLEEGEVDAA